MTTTFDIKNIVPNLQEMTVTTFYQFSNGEVFSNTIKVSDVMPVNEILAWGQDKCTWFDERAVLIEEMQHELLPETITQE